MAVKETGITYETVMRDLVAQNFAPVYLLMGERLQSGGGVRLGYHRSAGGRLGARISADGFASRGHHQRSAGHEEWRRTGEVSYSPGAFDRPGALLQGWQSRQGSGRQGQSQGCGL